VAGDALALPFADRSFDGILCTEVIEHVPDERDLVAELARVAAPGATMLLSSPFVHGLHEAPQDFRRLTSLGLVTALAASGWEVDRMVAIGGPAVVTIDSWCRWFDSTFRRAARAIRRRPGPVVVGISRIVQQALAATVLATPGWARRPIDPDLPLPRITLGYVVLARLVT
jgi:SAM-dependent methyltransferase